MRMLISGSGCLFLLAVALLPPGEFRLALAALTTGLAPMALSRRRWTPVAFACAAIIMGLPVWGLSALIAWGLSSPALLPWLPLGISLMAAAISFRISSPIKISRFALPDGLALGFIGLVAIPLIAGWMTNGPSGQGDNAIFKAGPGVSGDTFYHMGLIQESLNRHAWPDENPVFAGAPNHYPALIHVSLASLASLGNGPAGLALWPIFPIYSLAGITLLFCAVWKLSRARTKQSTSLIAFFFLTFLILRIDHFLTFQAQAFAYGFLALALLFIPRMPPRLSLQWALFLMAIIVLILSHTVTATIVLVYVCCYAALSLMRKRWVKFYYSTSTALISGFLYLALNHYQRFPVVENTLPSGFIADSLQAMILPFVAPLFCALFLIARQKIISPFTLASFLLLIAAIYYVSLGYTGTSYAKVFFNLFNGPRFIVLALLLLIPGFNFHSRANICAVALLLTHSFVFPNGPQRTNYNLLFGPPQVFKQADLNLFHSALKPTSQNGSVLTLGEDYVLPAISGKPLYVSGGAYFNYALDTVDERESVRRLQDQAAFFSNIAPADRITYMRTNHIDTVALKLTPESNPANFLPAEEVTVTKGADWTLFQLKPTPFSPPDLPKNSNSH